MPKSEEDRKIRPSKRKKNESLELLRNVAKSMAGAVPFASDEAKATIEDSLARPMAGLASQYMGYNEDTGQVENTAVANLRRIWNADERRKRGLPPEKRVLPGIVTDTGSLLNMLGNGPEWSQKMQELADATHQGVNQGMGLSAPEGLRQHTLDSAGIMLGQLPVPGKAKVDAAKQSALTAMQLVKKYGKEALKSPIEFFSPTVDPKMSNYLFGAGAGGGLGALGDEVPMEEPRAPHVVARAKGGKVGVVSRLLQILRNMEIDPVEFDLIDENGNLRIAEAKEVIEDAVHGEREVDDFRSILTNSEDPSEVQRQIVKRVMRKAEGGKVGALQAFLKSISLNPDARVKQTAHQMGDPVEEVLYATNEGQRRGVLTSVEAKHIKDLLARGEEEELSDALMELHAKLNPQPVGPATMQATPSMVPQPSVSGQFIAPEKGWGDWDPGEFAEKVLKSGVMRKAEGGKVQALRKILARLAPHTPEYKEADKQLQQLWRAENPLTAPTEFDLKRLKKSPPAQVTMRVRVPEGVVPGTPEFQEAVRQNILDELEDRGLHGDFSSFISPDFSNIAGDDLPDIVQAWRKGISGQDIGPAAKPDPTVFNISVSLPKVLAKRISDGIEEE